MFNFAKRHQTLLQSQNHFKEISNGIPIPCYVGG
jgi:hypothetical protein